VSKNVKKSLLRAKLFSPNRSIWVFKKSRVYADFRSEGIIQKKCTKKDHPKNCFSKKKP
jgi:hypothetical protein